MPQKDSEILFDQASEAWDAGKIKQAFKLFSMAAEAGNVSALNNLGVFHDNGLGVPRNRRKALQLFKRVARKGEAHAMSNVGTVYRDWGNFKRAQFWFLKAFKSGDGDAALEMAKLYLKRNATGDISRASKYLRSAIDAKHICEASVEEATELLKKLKAKAAK